MPFANYKSKWNNRNQNNNNYDTAGLQRSADNARLRIEDAGYKTEDADSRNWFEKATNLPENQNFLFDTLELVSRPGQGVLNVIKNGPENIPKNFARGFAGKDRVRGSEIVANKGFDSGLEKAILGTGLEIVTDPLSLIPGGTIAKGLGAAGRGAKKGYTAAENLAPRMKQIREDGIQPRATDVKDRLGYMFNPDYKATETLSGGQSDEMLRGFRKSENDRRYLKDQYMDKLTDSAKLSGGVEQGAQVGRMMEKDLKTRLDSEQMLNDIVSGKPITLDTDQGNINDFISKANEKMLGTNAVRQTLMQRQETLSGVNNRIKDLERRNDMKSIIDNGPANNKQERLLSRHESLSSRANKLNEDIDALTNGIRIKPTENGKFRVAAPSANVMKEVIDDPKRFIDDISPTATFNDVADPKMKPNVEPIARELLEKGKVKTDNIKGTATEKELKRLLGDKVKFSHGKRSTINLIDTPSDIDSYQFKQPIKSVEVDRIAREMPSSPEINQSAQQLMKSNQEIRDLAKQNGININELEGYMTHIFSKAEREARKKIKPNMIDSKLTGLNKPSKSILNQRKLTGSVEDINERVGREMFEPNAYFATAIGQQRLIDYIHAASFRKQVLTNPRFARKYDPGMDIPNNGVVIDAQNYKFIKEGDELLEGMPQTEEIGGKYLVTKATKEKLDRYKYTTTDEGSKAFLRAFDKAQSFWKRAALFSLPYHLRNDVGAKFNNWVGGMSLKDLSHYSLQADRVVFNAIMRGKKTELYDEFQQQGLGPTSQSQVELMRRGDEPEKVIERSVKEKSKDLKGKTFDRLNPLRAFETSREVGDYVDQTNRFAVYKWAREKKNMSPEEAAAKARETQFDYTNTTTFEQNFMVRAFPFYRWARNNVPYQIKSFINDPRKYANVNKLRLNAQDAAGINEENVPEFMKEGFYFPVASDGKGSGRMLGFNLPSGDLADLSNPGKMAFDMVTPLAKTPAELITNRNFFYDSPIEKFEGQERQLSALGKGFGVPEKTAYALEQAGGQIGRSAFKALGKKEDQDTKFRKPPLGISGVLKEFNADKENYFQSLDQLKKLQDYINYIEQQTGVRPRTVNEIR